MRPNRCTTRSLEKKTLHSSNGGIYIGDQPYQHFQDSIFATHNIGHKIEENECVKLLLQSLLDSYDQLIINLTNNNQANSLVFDDVVASILNEESKRKNKEKFAGSGSIIGGEREINGTWPQWESQSW